MPTEVGEYDVQASPGVLALCKGWGLIRDMADEVAPQWEDHWWVRESHLPRHGLVPPGAPLYVRMLMWEYEGMLIEVMGYIDSNGVKVFSFDPARKLHSLQEGHQRQRGRND